MYKEVLSKVTTFQDMMCEDISALIAEINAGEVSDVQIAGFQVALLMKGATQDELAYFAKAMCDNCVPLRPKVSGELMDTCGTGGGRWMPGRTRSWSERLFGCGCGDR